MSVWDKQQTVETIRANIELHHAVFNTNTQSYDEWKAKDRAEKLRKAKIRQINKWRAKRH